jgi:aminoglycoside phosphotransferase (APT) family kinase protein
VPSTTRASRCAESRKAKLFQQHGRVLAAIHKIDVDAVGLSDYGPRGNYYRRQIDRWSGQYRASETGRSRRWTA